MKFNRIRGARGASRALVAPVAADSVGKNVPVV